MSTRGLRALTLAGAAAVLAMASVACSSSEQPTPIYVTPPPTPTAEASTPAPTEVPSDTPFATFTPWPTGTPTPVPTPTPTPAPIPTPVPTPTSPAAFCSGTASNQTFFLQAAHSVKFTVYCATLLPSGWAISGGTWAGNSKGGTVTVTYKYRNTSATIVVQEGAFCSSAAVTCEGGPHPAAGSGHTGFDGMTGAFYALTSGFMVSVAPGTTHAYMLTATNIVQATVAGIAANFKAVPKT